MKNETARREIESLDYYLQNHTDDYSEESHTAMMMGIKALEQEPVIDKIRAEIQQKIVIRPALNHSRTERDRNDAFLEVLDIIDKYRKEQEDNGFFDEIMDESEDEETYEKIKEIIDKVKEQEE